MFIFSYFSKDNTVDGMHPEPKRSGGCVRVFFKGLLIGVGIYAGISLVEDFDFYKQKVFPKEQKQIPPTPEHLKWQENVKSEAARWEKEFRDSTGITLSDTTRIKRPAHTGINKSKLPSVSLD